MNDDLLLHYGKKGMKWGVRKAIKSDISSRINGIKSDIKAVKDSNNAHNMSTKTLKKKTERYGTERALKKEVQALGRFSTDFSRLKSQYKARKNYRNRGSMSTKRMKTLINRYRMENQVRNNGSEISDDHRRQAKRAFDTYKRLNGLG